MNYLTKLLQKLGLKGLTSPKFNPDKWNWYHYLAASKATKYRFHGDAVKKSNSWVTCAVGQLCSAIPKSKNHFGNAPDDEKLANLGMEFMYKIRQREYHNAKLVLDKIERRTVQVLYIMEQENKTKW